MRERSLIFSIIAVIACTSGAVASDCGDADCDITATEVEELLVPERPSDNLWLDTVVTPEIYEVTSCEITPNDALCPFDTETECEIWRTKPTVREVVAPRSPKIHEIKMQEFLCAFREHGYINGDDPTAKPFLERYKMLMESARTCCTAGINYNLRVAGASRGLLYKFMVDDANFYNMYDRCLMTNDVDIAATYNKEQTTRMVTGVRNECLCHNKQWYRNLLAPFVDAWRQDLSFAASEFEWSYTDGVGRTVDVSINDDVETVLKLLDRCP